MTVLESNCRLRAFKAWLDRNLDVISAAVILWASIFLHTTFGQALREQLLLILSFIMTGCPSYLVLLTAWDWAWYDISLNLVDSEPALDFISKRLLWAFDLDALAQILALLIIYTVFFDILLATVHLERNSFALLSVEAWDHFICNRRTDGWPTTTVSLVLRHERCGAVIRLVWAWNLASISTSAQLVVHGKIMVLTSIIAAPVLPLLRLLLMKLFIVTLSCVGGKGTRLHLEFLLSLSVRCLVLQWGRMIAMSDLSVHFLAFVRGGILWHLEIWDVQALRWINSPLLHHIVRSVIAIVDILVLLGVYQVLIDKLGVYGRESSASNFSGLLLLLHLFILLERGRSS